jgi:two-component system, sensor histidine kinase PdtaS
LKRKISVLLILLLCASIGRSATNTDSIELLVNYSPKKAIQILLNRQLLAPTRTNTFHLAVAYTNYGKYVISDSIVSELLNRGKFGLDSPLYMRVLSLNSTNKKVLNRYEDAFISLNKMYEYYTRNRNDSGLLEVYLAFVEYYRAANNFAYGLAYAEKTNALIQSMSIKPSPVFTMRMLHRKAAILAEQSLRNDSVIHLSLEVIKLGMLYNEPKQVAIASNELGFYLYNQKKQLDLGEKYLKQAYLIWDSLQYPLYVTNASFNLAKLYAVTNRYDEALRLADKGIRLVKENEWGREEGFWYELLGNIYADLKQYKLAYEYEHKSKELLTQYAYQQFKERLAFYSNQLNVKEKEDEVLRTHLELENKLHENKLLLSLLVALSVLLVIAVGGILIIMQQKRIMKKQQTEIFEINTELKKLLSLKDVLVKEVNHRVKNNLSLLSGIMYLKEKELDNHEAAILMNDMQSRINTISLIHETLYQREDVEHINFQEYLERLCKQTISLYAGQQQVNVSIQCVGFEPKLSLAIPLGMIINELITNSLKHAFANVSMPEIRISYHSVSNQLYYTDNGPGYDANKPVGSLGSKLINILATQINANISYKTTSAEHTIQLNLNNISI